MVQTIHIDNLKCSGCANSIKKRLASIHGISSVKVDLAEGSVHLETQDLPELADKILNALKSMGYTPVGTSGFVDKAKSYVSCAIGRITDKVE